MALKVVLDFTYFYKQIAANIELEISVIQSKIE